MEAGLDSDVDAGLDSDVAAGLASGLDSVGALVGSDEGVDPFGAVLFGPLELELPSAFRESVM